MGGTGQRHGPPQLPATDPLPSHIASSDLCRLVASGPPGEQVMNSRHITKAKQTVDPDSYTMLLYRFGRGATSSAEVGIGGWRDGGKQRRRKTGPGKVRGLDETFLLGEIFVLFLYKMLGMRYNDYTFLQTLIENSPPSEKILPTF